MKFKYLLLILSVLISTSALSQPSNAILGTWKGTSNAAIIGSGTHYSNNNHEKVDVVFRKVDFIILIDKVDGRNFSGTASSKSYTELIAGAFKKDLKNGVLVSENGSTTFELTSPNTLEICYTQVTPKFIALPNIASCSEYQKQ